MLIFVYGDDTFRVQEKVAELKLAFVKKFDPTNLNAATFPAEPGGKINAGEALQAIASLPFLATRRLVVMRDLVGSLKKDDAKVWVEGLKKTPESSIVVLWETTEPKALEKKPLFKELKEAADVHFYPFPALEGSELSKWTAGRIKIKGGAIATDALRELVDRVGADLWQMEAEVQKLIAFAGDAQITRAMVQELVRASFEGEIFALMDAISQKKTAEALKLLQQERWSGSDDHYLLTMLARQVRILLGARAVLDDNPRASKDEAAEALGVHPFVATKALTHARAFTLADLRAVHELLYQYDLALKTSRIDVDLAVDLTTMKLLK